MLKTILIVLIPAFILAESAYFQQDVKYTIEVTLDDSTHTLTAHETLIYTNHSPDTLEFIWFHLWPNAYKNTETAYAKQAFKNGSTRFYYAKDENRGYIDNLDFSIEGTPAEWAFHEEWIDVAKVMLHQPLLPGESITIETPFFVKLPKVYSRLGHTGKHYEITQWYPKPAVYDRNGWHPMPYLNMGEFYSEFGTFDVKITLPENYRIMATGDLVNGEAEFVWLDSLAIEGDALHTLDKKEFKKKMKVLSGRKKSKLGLLKKDDGREIPEENTKTKTLHFRQENVHDFAWFADPKWIVRKGELKLADSTRTVTLWSMYLPKNAELWEKSLEYIHDAGYWYSEFYGDYPYNHITAVDGDMSAGGGMEYPNITVISSGGSKDLLEFVIMHEVGHNWFYGILGSDEREHAWMDEGLNEYANIKYWEKKYPERNGQIIVQDFIQNKLGIAKHIDFRWMMGYMGYAGRAISGDDQPIELPSVDYHPGNYGSIVYAKSAIVLRFLQHYLGEQKMDKIMQDYYETWKFKHPQPGDFRSLVESHLDEDLSWFFDDLINDTKVIDYAIEKDVNGIVLRNNGTITCPVEVAYYDAEGNEIGNEWHRGISSPKQIEMPENAVKAVIDPTDQMPDIRRTNNSTKRPIKFHFVFDQPDYGKKEWYWLPWLIGNTYNGATPGLVLYSGFIPTYDYGISLVPMWDFKHERPIGLMSGKKTWYKMFGFRSLTLGGGFSEFGNRSSQKLSFDGVIKKPIVSTPTIILNGVLYHQNLTGEMLDPTYYDDGEFVVSTLGVAYSNRTNPLINYQASARMMTGFGDNSFTKVHFSANVHRRWTQTIRSGLRFWIGGYIGESSAPKQYRTYLGGGVDPNFENRMVFDRSANAANIYNILDEQFVEDGPSLHGRAADENGPIISEELSWGVNFSQSVPKLPFSLFADIAGASDLGETYIDAGLKFNLANIKIYIPLYQSWDENQTPEDFGWVKDRMRFEIGMPNMRFGR